MNHKLTIGFDAKRAVCNMTGLGNYSRFVINAMSGLYPMHDYRLYSPSAAENERLSPLLDRENVTLHTPAKRIDRALPAFWRTAWLTEQLRDDSVDIYHGLSNELPLTIAMAGIPSVVTIHDLIYRRQPRDYSAIDRRLYDFKYRRSARIASRVIAISECTKRDLVNDYGIAPEKIDVIYQGCDPIFNRHVDFMEREAIRQKYGLPRRFIIAVGTVQPRKNQLLAVKALRGLPQDVKLVIVGGRQKDYAREIDRYIASNRLDDRVVWLSGIPFADLPALYALAAVSAYPSRYEGFGIPVIESLSVGTPVIAATGSCLEEAGGAGAIYVGPDDVDAFIDAANTIITDGYRRGKLAENGRRHVKRFTIEDFARRTMATYTKALLT